MKINLFYIGLLLWSNICQLGATHKAPQHESKIVELLSLSLEQLLQVKINVANRYPSELRNAPSSVTVFTADQIEALGVKYLEQLLSLVPGIQVVRGVEGGGNSSINVRGRHSDNGANRDILVLFDGMRLNEPITSGAFTQEQQISLSNVERVEVIRGPGSTLYGANAFLAVVNIITNKTQNRFSILSGSNNAKGGEIQVSHHGEDWRWSLAIDYFDDSGQQYPGFYSFGGHTIDTQDPNHREDYNFFLEFSEFSLSLRKSKRENSDFIVGGAQLNGLQTQRLINDSARFQYKLSGDRSEASFYYETQKGLSDILLGISPFNPQPPLDPASGLYWTDGSIDAFVGGNIRTVKQQRVGVDAYWNFNHSHRIAYGLVYREESTGLNPFQGNWNAELLENTGELIPSTPDNFIQNGFYISGVRFDLFNPESRRIRGLYLQDEYRIDETLMLTVGLRNDHYDDFGGHLSLRSGLVYDRQDTFIKLLYGEAFRAPSFLETRAGIGSGGIANPGLKPEKVKTTELVWGQHQENWNATFTLYHNQFTDIIVPVLVDDVVPGFTAFQSQNRDKESNAGIEMQSHFQISERWKLSFGGDYIFNELASQPVANLRAFAELNFINGDWQLNISNRYLGKITSREANISTETEKFILADYWLTDLNLRWRYSKAITTELHISNVFDREYHSFSPQNGIENGLPGRSRDTHVSIDYQW